MKIKEFFNALSCDIHNNIVEPLSRWKDSRRKTHYECCVCGKLEAPYFDDIFKGSMRWDYGWYKLDRGRRWICHHCVDHGYAPLSIGEPTFEEWQKEVVTPTRNRIRELIKTKDIAYYNTHYFYEED